MKFTLTRIRDLHSYFHAGNALVCKEAVMAILRRPFHIPPQAIDIEVRKRLPRTGKWRKLTRRGYYVKVSGITREFYAATALREELDKLPSTFWFRLTIPKSNA